MATAAEKRLAAGPVLELDQFTAQGANAPLNQQATRSHLPATQVQEPETLTMEDLLREDQNSIRALAHGDIVDGTVVRVDPDEVLVDIGAKSEGIISNRELAARGEQPVSLNPGDHVCLEDPGYPRSQAIFRALGAKLNSLC